MKIQGKEEQVTPFSIKTHYNRTKKVKNNILQNAREGNESSFKIKAFWIGLEILLWKTEKNVSVQTGSSLIS